MHRKEGHRSSLRAAPDTYRLPFFTPSYRFSLLDMLDIVLPYTFRMTQRSKNLLSYINVMLVPSNFQKLEEIIYLTRQTHGALLSFVVLFAERSTVQRIAFLRPRKSCKLIGRDDLGNSCEKRVFKN